MPRKAGPGRPRTAPHLRFWPKVDKSGDCWQWTAQINADGYGRFFDGTRKVLAHRFAWEQNNGPIPTGMQIDHACLNRRCVNPHHLRLVTHFENMQNLVGAQSRNPTGIRGVHRVKGGASYRAAVTVAGRVNVLGFYSTAEEAGEVARKFRIQHMTHNEIDRRAA